MVGLGAYSVSKAGLLGLMHALSRELGPSGVRVNAVAPGYFPTEMTDEMDPKEGELVKMITPAGRFGEPHEIGDAVVCLAAAAAWYHTGRTLPVAGGGGDPAVTHAGRGVGLRSRRPMDTAA